MGWAKRRARCDAQSRVRLASLHYCRIFNLQSGLLLAFGAVVAAAARDDDAFDWRLADKARLALASVDTVFELEESFFAVGVDLIGDGGATECDCFFQDLFHGDMELA